MHLENTKNSEKKDLKSKATLGSLWGSSLIAALIPILCVLMGFKCLHLVGWTFLVAIPFIQGLVAVLLYTYSCSRTYMDCCCCVLVSFALIGIGLLLFMHWGIIVVTIVFLAWFLLAMIGGSLGYLIQKKALE
jgi:hypothetical protein